jgi:hypothetical protein
MNQLKQELQQSINDMKISQQNFEQSMLDRQTKYETKLDKVTSNIQKDLTITNKNMAKIHSVLKTHVTENFMDACLMAMTNHLTNCFQTALHQSRSHSVEEEPNAYMHIDEDDDSSKWKLENSTSLPDNKKKIGKENNSTAKKLIPNPIANPTGDKENVTNQTRNQNNERRQSETKDNRTIHDKVSKSIRSKRAKSKNKQHDTNKTKNDKRLPLKINKSSSENASNETDCQPRQTRSNRQPSVIIQQTNPPPPPIPPKTTQATSHKLRPSIQLHIIKIPKANNEWESTITNKTSDTVKIYFQNINGLQERKFHGRWTDQLKYMEQHDIDICGLAETNTNWKFNNTREELTTKAKLAFKNSAINFSINQFNPKRSTNYQPGGCVQICKNHWTGRIIRQIDDPRTLRRWTGQTFWLKGDRLITVITGYRPCRYSTTHLLKAYQTVHRQQTTILESEGFKHPDPRKIFITDLIKAIKDEEKNPGNSCIMMMDANEAIEDKEGPLRKIFNETTLVDALHAHTGQECQIPTYSRGTKRIDFILTSHDLIPHINKVGYTAFYDASESDHRGAFIELSDKIIDNKIELKRPKKRQIGSKSKKEAIY